MAVRAAFIAHLRQTFRLDGQAEQFLFLCQQGLRKNISVSSVKDTEMIEITVTNGNPTYATKAANEIAK
ncbi:MAG: hypothetical protein IKI30_00940, partial [Oxalobacter sp.]|nr:hypothetical protein [Oxalobacter sp.]